MDCPSTPAAPRVAFTCLYASHTSRLAIQNGLALSMLVIPFRVVGWVKPDDGVPSVQRHYSTFVPTTDASAPVFRIGTLVLAVTDRLDFSLSIGTTGSCVPYRSPSQGHAAFMPDAGWAVGRLPPTLARGTEVQIPVSTSMNTLRHVISGLLAFVSLSNNCRNSFRLFTQSSHTRLFTLAACVGL